MIRIVVDRLLAEDDQFRLFLVDECLEQLRDSQRLQVFVRLDQNRTVRAVRSVSCVYATPADTAIT